MVNVFFFHFYTKIYNWTPRVFNETDASQLTNEEERNQYQKMPDFLKEAIANTRDQREVSIFPTFCLPVLMMLCKVNRIPQLEINVELLVFSRTIFLNSET